MRLPAFPQSRSSPPPPLLAWCQDLNRNGLKFALAIRVLGLEKAQVPVTQSLFSAIITGLGLKKGGCEVGFCGEKEGDGVALYKLVI